MGLPKIAFDEPDFATVLNAPLQYGDDGAVLGPDFIVISDGVTRAQDSAFFSHQLVQLISAGLPRLPRRDLGKEIYHLVEYAQDLMISVKLPGSATLSIVVRNGNELYIATLGDSEVKVLRGSSVIYRSPMQRSGSTPGQLNARRPGGVEEMHIERIRIQPGDTTIAATDGLWDNLLEKEVVTLVKHSRHSDAVSLAGTLMRQAQVMKEGNRKHCSDGGNRRCVGARRDDITIIVAKV
jgi:serine/threonine protein phosphatase PrpC